MKSRSSNGTWIRLWQIGCVAALTALGGLASKAAEDGGAADAEADQLHSPTHRQVRIIEPKVDGRSVSLYTIATTPEGQILAGVRVGAGQGAVLMLDSEGETLEQWSLELTPTGIAVAPDGTAYVGGSGRIAQLGPNGTVVKVIDSPHVGSVEELKKKAAESYRLNRERMNTAYTRQVELLEKRVETIEEKDEADRSGLETAQLKAYKTQLDAIQKMLGSNEENDVPDHQLNAAMTRSMSVTSMAASDKDLFLCATDPSQGGYSVWRVGRDLDAESSEMIMDGLRGCCGQMDIQCCEGMLVVSENTRFKVGIYDRHGRAQKSFGRRDRSSRDGFGSCCNPMNALPLSDGTILTAESSIGHIKRFDQDGNLVAYIGKAKIGGGCKHCALGYDKKNDLYYMMYQDKNAICVLANNESTPVTLAEKKMESRRNEFLAKAAGQWNWQSKTNTNDKTGGGVLSLFGGGRGGSTNQPVSSLKVEPNGEAKILEGMYKAYGDDASIELLAANEDAKAIPFALSIDQVRFIEGTWQFEGDDLAKISFQGTQALTFKRDAKSSCAGSDCDDPNCKEENCPQHTTATTVNALEADIEIDAVDVFGADAVDVFGADAVEGDGMMMQDLFDDSPGAIAAAMTPPIEYKLLSKKELGDNAEATLNELGKDGWDFCGRIGKQLMFKRYKPWESDAINEMFGVVR